MGTHPSTVCVLYTLTGRAVGGIFGIILVVGVIAVALVIAFIVYRRCVCVCVCVYTVCTYVVMHTSIPYDIITCIMIL